MFESVTVRKLARNLGIYAVGVGLAVAGALGIAAAIELSFPLAAILFAAGIAIVIYVHESLGGPV